MRFRENLLLATVTFIAEPLGRRTAVRRLCVQVELHVGEILQETDEEEREIARDTGPLPLPLREETEDESGARARPRSMGSAMG